MLKLLNYVDENNLVTLKGRVACEIHHQVFLLKCLCFIKNKEFRSC